MYFCNSESVSNSEKPEFWIEQFEPNRAKFHLGNVLKQPLLWKKVYVKYLKVWPGG